MKKTTQLKKMIQSPNLEVIMEAHSGISAKIVEETGFKGIWASGLSISASLGVRDNNEASWTQILNVLEFMNDATKIPILLDGDTGYGNFNNARRLVQKLEQRNIAGVCIEDKLFPKTNSFIQGEAQPLANVEEFTGKIKAMKDTQKDKDFTVVARTEAFIAGWGLEEAIRRAEAYRLAGADAILVHSKRSDCSEVEAFMNEWGNRHPVVIVPTKYYTVPFEKFMEIGVQLVIWANHNIRASIQAMQKTSKQIYHDKSIQNVEPVIVPVKEIFRLQNVEELRNAEKKYLPQMKKNRNAIILAASQGELEQHTVDKPKCLIDVNGKSLLSIQMDYLHQEDIKDIVIVRGFEKEKVLPINFKTVDNDKFNETTELYSLFLSKDFIKGDTIISYGDILFKDYVLKELLNDQHDITLVVDADVEWSKDSQDLVSTKQSYSKKCFSRAVEFLEMSSKLEKSEVHGEFIGLWKVSEKGAKVIKDAFEELESKENFKQLTMADLFNLIRKKNEIHVIYIKGSWLNINTILDLRKAGEGF